MATRTLEELRERALIRADVVASAAGKHDPDVVDQYVNEALEEYHLELTECGHPQKFRRTTLSTTASSAVTNGIPAHGYVTLPSDFMQLLGIWIVEDDGSHTPLDAFTEHDYMNAGDTGKPLRFRLAEDDDGLKVVRILPNADAVYTIAVTYVPNPEQLEHDSASFTFFPGTAELVICDAALRLLEDDGVQEGSHYQAVQARREQARQRLYKHAMRQNRAAPTVIDPPPRLGNYAHLPDYLR